MKRRELLLAAAMGLGHALLRPAFAEGGHAPEAPPVPSAKEGLKRLMEGNERFVTDTLQRSHLARDYRKTLQKEQHPFATILGCSDSRVPPEMVFDVGVGDLFIVRVAGNVVSPDVRGSVAYAFEHLHTPLFVVMGHEGCGAVTAALQEKLKGTHDLATIDELLRMIDPALKDLPPTDDFATLVQRAVEANVRWSMRQLTATPGAKKAIADGRATIVGSVYELATGRVRLLDSVKGPS